MQATIGIDEARELLLVRAGQLGLLEDGRARAAVTFASREAEDAVIAQVLDAEVRTPQPSEEECRRHYEANPGRFTSGELVEASHILFAVTPGAPVAALRARAEQALHDVAQDPATFAEQARALSNCPSAEQGGNLGQFGRGEMVPEFDRAVFGAQATGVLPALVATRYGFHVVLVARRVEGRLLPFEAVRERIGAYLAQAVEARAVRQYVQVLAGRAALEAGAAPEAASPLVQ